MNVSRCSMKCVSLHLPAPACICIEKRQDKWTYRQGLHTCMAANSIIAANCYEV